MNRRIMSSAIAATALAVLAVAQLATAGDDACGECMKKVCVPKTEVKKVAHRCYNDVCEDFCVGRIGDIFGSFFRGWSNKNPCLSCGCEASCKEECDSCGKCEKKPRTRKHLLVKIKREEVTVTKCEPAYECAPVCEPVCEPAPCAPACERAPLFKRKQEFCCPDYSNPYAGTALDPHAVPAKPAGKVPEPLPAPKKEEKPEPKGAAGLPPELKLGGQQ